MNPALPLPVTKPPPSCPQTLVPFQHSQAVRKTNTGTIPVPTVWAPSCPCPCRDRAIAVQVQSAGGIVLQVIGFWGGLDGRLVLTFSVF